eukprot:2719518-Rhodomonas_salina.1
MCAVLRERIVVRARYRKCGTEIAYSGTGTLQCARVSWYGHGTESAVLREGMGCKHAEAAFKSALLRRAVTLPLLGSMA